MIFSGRFSRLISHKSWLFLNKLANKDMILVVLGAISMISVAAHFYLYSRKDADGIIGKRILVVTAHPDDECM